MDGVFTGMEEFSPTVHISEKFLKVVRALDAKIPTEFSVLGKAEIDGDKYTVGDEYYIPEQEVESASVDYKEDMYRLREQGWNAVVHKHPDGIMSFSGPDYEYLNNQFDLSLLWVEKKFNDATVRLEVGDKYIVIRVDKNNIHTEEEVVEVSGLEKIKKKVYKWVKQKPKFQQKLYDDEYFDRIYKKWNEEEMYDEKFNDTYKSWY